jgi:hypothetical protein
MSVYKEQDLPGVVGHNCNTNTSEVEAGGLQV